METDHVLAFRHTHPSYLSHIVVIPKRHVPSLLSLGLEDNTLLLGLLDVVKAMAEKTMQEHGACRIVTNLGSYQESKHLHWHVVYGKL